MSLHIYPAIEQRSEAWFEQRRGMVTASVVKQLLTATGKVADNDVSRGLIASLTAERITGDVESGFVSDDMMRGILHEPIARDRYAEVTGTTVKEIGFAVLRVAGARLGYSPDGLVGDDGLLEVKCPRAKSHLRTIVAGEVPAVHIPQLQTGLLVMGREWIDFVSFCAGMPLFIQRVYPDPKWQSAISAAVLKAEDDIKALTAAFHEKAIDMPATERVPDLDELSF